MIFKHFVTLIILAFLSLISGVLSAESGCCAVQDDLIQVTNSLRGKLKMLTEKGCVCCQKTLKYSQIV